MERKGDQMKGVRITDNGIDQARWNEFVEKELNDAVKCEQLWKEKMDREQAAIAGSSSPERINLTDNVFSTATRGERYPWETVPACTVIPMGPGAWTVIRGWIRGLGDVESKAGSPLARQESSLSDKFRGVGDAGLSQELCDNSGDVEIVMPKAVANAGVQIQRRMQGLRRRFWGFFQRCISRLPLFRSAH